MLIVVKVHQAGIDTILLRSRVSIQDRSYETAMCVLSIQLLWIWSIWRCIESNCNLVFVFLLFLFWLIVRYLWEQRDNNHADPYWPHRWASRANGIRPCQNQATRHARSELSNPNSVIGGHYLSECWFLVGETRLMTHDDDAQQTNEMSLE